MQTATIVNPRAAMQSIYDQWPNLAEFTLKTEGFECVGTPIGSQTFVDYFMQDKLTSLQTEFQLLLPYLHLQDFLLFLLSCCNTKIMHLLRH